jgi:phosphinothricin acetyltransferase
MIRACRPADAAQICSIYNPYVRDTVITFEETPVAEDEMVRRISAAMAVLPWLVFEHEGVVEGYAYATPWKARSAYRFAVESTVYVARGFVGRGIGTRLYEALIAELRARGLHCVMGGIALPNPASVALHERLGFTKVAQFLEVGFKLGRRVDVAYWDLML